MYHSLILDYSYFYEEDKNKGFSGIIAGSIKVKKKTRPAFSLKIDKL